MSFADEIKDYQNQQDHPYLTQSTLRELETKSKPKGIAFEGGGICGLGHVGVCKYLDQKHLYSNLTYFAGSSAGAMIAGLAACRISVANLEEIMTTFDFTSLNDSNWLFVSDLYRFHSSYGWSKGDNIQDAYGQILQKYIGQSDITLKQIEERYGTHLILTTTSWRKKKTIYLSNHTHPDMTLKEAVRKSASYPINFTPSISEKDNDYYLDGGTLDNYPIRALYTICDPDEVIGCKLVSTETVPSGPLLPPSSNSDQLVQNNLTQSKLTQSKLTQPKAPSLTQYFWNIIEMYQNLALRAHVHASDWAKTIQIDIGTVSTLDFDIDLSTKQWLIQQGYNGADHYFS